MNILFLLADQLRSDFVGSFGADFIQTSAIDSLAEDGVLYENAISQAPICVPIRAAMMSGLNPIQSGVIGNDHWLDPRWREMGLKTWPLALSEAGYHTFGLGKMHFYPWDIMEGFDERLISEDKRHIPIKDNYADHLANNGMQKLYGWEEEGYRENLGASYSGIPLEHMTDVWMGDEFIKFTDRHDKSKPFATMVGFNGPHCPYNPPKEIAELFNPSDMPQPIPDTDVSETFREHCIRGANLPWCQIDYTDFPTDAKMKIRAHYCGLVKIIDDQVGRIIQDLKDKDLYDDTLIIFGSDHGDYLGDYSLIAKSTFLQPSIHVPLIVKPPKGTQAVAGTRVQTHVAMSDIFATIMRAANQDIPDFVDSTPLPALFDDPKPELRTHIFGANRAGQMVMKGDWILAHYEFGTRSLFNLKEDPTEQINRYHDPAARSVRDELNEILIDENMKASNDRSRSLLITPGELKYKMGFGERGWVRGSPYPGFDDPYRANSNKNLLS